MSRSNYTETWNEWALICWRGAVASAIRGRRGQAFLKELLEALDNLPAPRLIAAKLQYEGEVCTLGALGLKHNLDMSRLDPEDYDSVAEAFQIAPALAREIVYENDEGIYISETPEQRFLRMRKWVFGNIKKESPK